jgi:hypothetical protein
MKATHFAVCLSVLAISGCDLIATAFPHKVTPAEAKEAIRRCGGSIDQIRWAVTEDGSLLVGTKAEIGPMIPGSVTRCLKTWGKWNRVHMGTWTWN